MSRTYLISIISEQTLPNYLFIKEFQNKVDKFVFITTKQMEAKEKTSAIIETAGIDKRQRIKITIEEDALYKAKEKLNKALPNISKEDRFLVNMTGGTKTMAIAVWEFFSKFNNARFFYVPIGKNIYRELFKNRPSVIKAFNFQISVEEYMKIHNINFVEEDLIFSEQQTEALLFDVHSTHYFLEYFPKNKVKKFGIINFYNKQIHTKWFEEFLYYRIKKILNLDKKHLKTGIKLKANVLNEEFFTNDNEIDIFFIFNNNPYMIEAKFSIGKQKINIASLNNYLFKLSAVNRRFGLNIKSTVMTLADLEMLGENAKKALQHKTTLLKIYFPFGRKNIINLKKLPDLSIFENNLKHFIN